MYARTLCLAAALLSTTYAHADDSETHIRAALDAKGQAAKLTVVSGGKHPGVELQVGKTKQQLYDGDAVATLEAGHGRIVIAVSIDSKKQPFQIMTLDGDKVSKPVGLARPTKSENFPFAIAATATPDGFTVFFQEVETANPSEAHTYMVELDKTGAVTEQPTEIQVPWWLAAATWNGNGYHLALFYTGGNGTTLSMVSLNADGAPEQHPDWATAAGSISDVHLVSMGSGIRAIYRGTGNHMYETNVTKIGQWGQVSKPAKDLGALAKTEAIAITAKGAVTKIKTK